ncbi:MAG: hypothetical protein K0M56_09150 [Kaistella sp.]|nr:hypothetical protein [Kaistella sp.]
MKKLTVIFLLTFSFCNSQIIKDSIIGKPLYVKEYVLFLQNSGPFTFMQGDSEYGHAVMMVPKFLRKNMARSWFETDFCRYINNETHYTKDRKITKEIWFSKSGEIIDDYNYEYDALGRLKQEKSKNTYSEDAKLYFYEGNAKTPRFEKNYYKKKNDSPEFYLKDNNEWNHLLVSEFDSISKTDSVFSVTNQYMKSLGERTYTSAKDTIYHKRLIKVKMYDSLFRVINEKIFNPDDYNIKKVFLEKNILYEYDLLGIITKKTEIKDDKYHYFIQEKNGKYREEIKDGGYASVSSVEYKYYNDGKLDTRTHYYQGNISHQIHFEYDDYNLITKLLYLDTWGKNKNDLKPTVVTFKYKFDKHKNWTECIKNVDGKDLYLWKREIQYYK